MKETKVTNGLIIKIEKALRNSKRAVIKNGEVFTGLDKSQLDDGDIMIDKRTFNHYQKNGWPASF